MSTLIELTAQIVSAHLSNNQMSSDEMLQELQKVHASLKALETGIPIGIENSTTTEAPKLTIKQAFKKDEIICMVCGKGGFKTLKRHLSMAHDLKPGQYRKQFNIPSSISLSAKNYSDARRASAIEMNLGEGLVKARATRKANAEERIKNLPAKRVKAPVPVVIKKAGLPSVIKKAAVPAKIEVTKAPVAATKKKTAGPVKVVKKK